MKDKTVAMMTVFALSICLPVLGHASKSELTPSALAVIKAPQEDDVRLLFQFTLPTLKDGYEIQYAHVRFILPSRSVAEEYDLYAISRSWSPTSVGWDNPWSTPGGDVRAERIGSWVTDERTGDLVKFDVTEAVRAFAAGKAENYGFVVVGGEANKGLLVLPSGSATLTLFTGPTLNKSAK